ncbi:DUF1707 domain-containing protein [Spongiactinospora sp. TRM90649]|uniref:DUF1707 SHOCT-like domain-containing protein n=1 Tax=Spongiactinospora sp. TRM90649 TaxID=3031114 RepID=UPI0023F7D383|nr:DUF1707 domain-containing protein [Spongiactinospora sp. TRM90649]MDF5757931.1 DUF1707 domain-containing protein [Spongiactinospora sp. TRM90649]
MTSRDDLRVGDAERDETMSALREHFAQGRLTSEELDERLGLALGAKTRGDLARLSEDLPPAHAVAEHDPSAGPMFDPRRFRPPIPPMPPVPPLPPLAPNMRHHRHGFPPIIPIVILAAMVVIMTPGVARRHRRVRTVLPGRGRTLTPSPAPLAAPSRPVAPFPPVNRGRAAQPISSSLRPLVSRTKNSTNRNDSTANVA